MTAQGFLLSRTVHANAFYQGFLLLAFSFCQRMAQKPFVKVFCCRPFLFVKEWLRNLLSRFFAAGHFFLSKSGSETFCQGFLLQAISFCQRMAQKPFVKASALLSRAPRWMPSKAILGQKGIHCFIEGGPSIPGVLGDLVDLHASCFGLLTDVPVVFEHHLHIPPLADPHLP